MRKTCAYEDCNKKVIPHRLNIPKKYCSKSCRCKASHRRISEPQKTNTICEYRNCNNVVVPHRLGSTKKYCCNYCKDKESYLNRYDIAFEKLKAKFDRRDKQFKQC